MLCGSRLSPSPTFVQAAGFGVGHGSEDCISLGSSSQEATHQLIADSHPTPLFSNYQFDYCKLGGCA
jgi:hypothetical protein